jgi:3-oxoacyl-[acyl-carrier protein] reductase
MYNEMKQADEEEEEHRTAIISGRGIGTETAIALSKKSVKLVVCSKTQSEINSVVEEIKKVTNHSGVLGIKCDVSIPSEVNSLIKSTLEKFGRGTIDILINNAAVVFNSNF